MSKDLDWQADLARYPRRPFLKEQSIWAIWVYRFGRRVDRRKNGILKSLLTKCYWLLFRFVETITGISLPKSADIGKGLKIWHFGNIFIHPDVKIGRTCTLRQGITIGNRHEDGPVPIIGDDVEFGAYAQVFGDVKIGNKAKIGAMSVVLSNVQNNTTVVGIPAKVINRSKESANE